MRFLFSLLVAAALSAPLSAQEGLASRSKGSATAPVTVYEMSDFQCPFCQRFALEIFPALEAQYVANGKVRWVFVNFPLTQLHPNAVAAAEVAMCAATQGKFWPVHDLLFRNQKAWAPLKSPAEYFLTFADSASLDRAAFQTCLSTGATLDAVKADAQGAAQAGATSTPSFYIEGGIMAGAQPVEVFAPILDSIYAAKTGTPAR